MCALLGISQPFSSWSAARKAPPSNFSGSVLIIGAGAAGMSAGHLLEQRGVKYKILEASDTHGGRMKTNNAFTDFPIPLGAEWLHTSRNELSRIVNNKTTKITTKLKGYSAKDTIGYYEENRLRYFSLADDFGPNFQDKKFINSSWLDFFNHYVLPSVLSNIQFNTEVTSIKYSDKGVTVVDRKNNSYTADKP